MGQAVIDRGGLHHAIEDIGEAASARADYFSTFAPIMGKASLTNGCKTEQSGFPLSLIFCS